MEQEKEVSKQLGLAQKTAFDHFDLSDQWLLQPFSSIVSFWNMNYKQNNVVKFQ